ncbi:MAG: PilZ domain-containing protein [Candidatus Omnitrophica bacterium]|nr:PilZ domain-containing protein [Candidatus Omnitrophota bacterium]
MQEKRRNIRVEKTLIIQYAQSTAEPLCWDSTTVKNISTEGILFNSHKSFAKGEILHFRFTIPTDPSNRLEAEGEVVESFIYGHGTRIKFVNLGEQQKKVINDYIEWIVKKDQA